MSSRPEVEGGGAGSCYCGKVSYQVDGPMRNVVACHCTQCRKQSGHFFAATSAAVGDVTISGEDALTWFEASEDAKRGFCSTCGSALFWQRNGGENISILAGTLDTHPGLVLDRHIFCQDKGSYYELDDGLPTFETTD